MSFVRRVAERLAEAPERVVLRSSSGDGTRDTITAGMLAARTETIRGRLRATGAAKGDRVVVVAANSAAWIATDLACLAEGIVTAPLYARAGGDEIAASIREVDPHLVLAGDDSVRDAIASRLPSVRIAHLEEIADFDPRGGHAHAQPIDPIALAPSDPVTIRTTSGTSGEPKGAVLTRANVDHMLDCTSTRLGELFSGLGEQERLFHYLPFCFAGSWVLLMTALVRGSLLELATDPARIAQDLAAARPHTFLNVPLLLERIRAGIEEKIRARGGIVAVLFERASSAALRRADGRASPADPIVLGIAGAILFRPIRKKLGTDLRALVCGSAPLARETQLFFEMLGVPVLQVYGLTETTAICTMDRLGGASAGRVGRAIEGVTMRLSESGEILVRGPNVFAGYWRRPEATAAAFEEGWLKTGDTGDVDAEGRWRITGRVKNVLVLSSGHNVSPEPLEEALRAAIPRARHVVVVGHGRPHVGALVAGDAPPAEIERALAEANARLPHYQKIRAFSLLSDTSALEQQCFTANGKLRRDAVAVQLASAIDSLYEGAAR
jgi:long-chain acyl-CoA synthetase